MATRRKAERALPALPESVGELTPDTPLTKDLAVWLTALLMRAAGGDEAAAAEAIRACTAVPSLWEKVSGLGETAERAWIEMLAGTGPNGAFTREATRRELGRLRREVAGETPSPVERLLAERVALCWLHATHADTQYAQRLADGMSFRESEFHQRRCERANRQLLRSIQTLATVRRLLRPVVQVNVAEQQINVAR